MYKTSQNHSKMGFIKWIYLDGEETTVKKADGKK
jgi:hypothetical protein